MNYDKPDPKLRTFEELNAVNKLELGKQRAREIRLRKQSGGLRDYYFADDIHKLLSEGAVVWGNCPFEGFSPDESTWREGKSGPAEAYDSTPAEDRQALLIGIRPIKQESSAKSVADKIKQVYDLCGEIEALLNEGE